MCTYAAWGDPTASYLRPLRAADSGQPSTVLLPWIFELSTQVIVVLACPRWVTEK